MSGSPDAPERSRARDLREAILLTIGTLAAAGLVMWASLPA